MNVRNVNPTVCVCMRVCVVGCDEWERQSYSRVTETQARCAEPKRQYVAI